jgi:3-oxoadipate enol-lactonase
LIEAEDIKAAVELNLDTWLGPEASKDVGHDLVDSRLIAARLAGLLTDAHHVELPWAGHLPSLERPPAMADLLLGFLRQKSDRRGALVAGLAVAWVEC